MEKTYNPSIIEPIVQKYWDTHKTFTVHKKIKKKKYYCLAMLPYPSGKIHMGHVRNYTISDVIARYQRMLGKNVLHPIGWDAFGLPAEEAAINHNIDPKKWTYQNIQYMKKQFKKLGFSYDWDREINTCDPNYYKWEQWLFNKLLTKKLVYKKKSFVNWCSNDKTVLANEQVIDGRCWRCQKKIIIKLIPQWFIKITAYAEKLLQDLKLLKQWPKKVIKMQKNWIGKLKGFEINFKILHTNQKIKIYTNRLDLLMGTTYISISPLHKLSAKELTKKELNTFIQNTYTINNYSNHKKHTYIGKKIKKYAIHPITNKKIPIWITNYTNITYNTKIKISTPGHNIHDWYFAKKYNIKIKYIILEEDNAGLKINKEKPNENKGILCNSYPFNNLHSNIAANKIFEILKENNTIKKKNKYKLQDWSISRQRYWGTPIPVTILKNHTIYPVPNHQLPITPPKIKTINDLKNIQLIYQNWKKIKINNYDIIRETDTFDTFIESSWYYIRYTDPHYKLGMINPKIANYWLPIDQYIGGIEHATMHLIYFRFFHKILYDLKLIHSTEPAKNLLCQGMVLSEAFYYINTEGKKKWIEPTYLQKKNNKIKSIKTIDVNNKKIISAGIMKMSKSKKNGISPNKMIKKYGSDTIRLFMMYAAPIQSDIIWNESGVKGMYRFLTKLWNLIYQHTHNITNTKKNIYNTENIQNNLYETISKVSHDIKTRKSFNTAIASIIKFTNSICNIDFIQKYDTSFVQNIFNNIIKMLYPFTPHISFTLWQQLNNNTNIDYEKWPIHHPYFNNKKNINFIIQINGKKKIILTVPYNINKINILNLLKQEKKISIILKKNKIKKIIYIKNKLMNLVI